MHFSRPSRRTAAFIAATGTFFLSASLIAQEPTGGGHSIGLTSHGLTYLEGYGHAVAPLEDLNGDGIRDFAVGLRHADLAGLNAGSIQILNGADGSIILEVLGHNIGDEFGAAVAACGDLDGDGIGDLLVGAPLASPGGMNYAGVGYALSSITGQELFKVEGQAPWDFVGECVAGIEDLDNDGVDDVLFSQVGFDGVGFNSGAVRVHSGAQGTLLRQVEGTFLAAQFSNRFAAIDDLNGDGLQDILVGSYMADTNGLGNNGSAFVMSGADGTQLLQIDGTASGDLFGVAVAAAGDVDLDGLPDLLIGASQFGVRPGYAGVYSGATGILIHEYHGEPGDFNYFGSALGNVGDLNGDGVPEQVVSAFREADQNGAVYVFSGADGSRMQRILGQDPGGSFGYAVVGFGADGGMDLDLLVGAPTADSGLVTDTGKAMRVSVDPMLHSSQLSISSAAGGTLQYDIDFPDSMAGRKAILLASIQGSGFTYYNGVGLPLGTTNLFDRTTAPPILGTVEVLDASGNGTATLTYGPGELALGIGKHLEVCAAGMDPVGSLPVISSTQASLKILP